MWGVAEEEYMYALLYLKWITYKNNNCRAQGTLCNVMWQPGWEGSLERMDTSICMAEALSYSPETITIFFVNWLYPNTK